MENSGEKLEKKSVNEVVREKKTSENCLIFLRENKYLWTILFIVVIVFLFTFRFKVTPPIDLPKGSASPKEIKSPFDFQVVDEVATRQKREEAKSKVVPVYDWDGEIGNKWQESLSSNFKKARDILQEYSERGSNQEKESRQKIEELFGPDITRFAIRQLMKENFSPSLEEILRDVLKKVGGKKIVSDEEKLTEIPAIKIRDIHRKNMEWEIKSPSTGEIIYLSTARRFVRELLDGYPELSPAIKAASEELLRTIIKPNLTFNSLETSIRGEKASSEVAPLVVFIKKGEKIVSKGEIVDDNIKEKLEYLGKISRTKVNVIKLFSLFLITLIILAFGFMYFKSYEKAMKIKVNIFNLTIGLFIITLIFTHFFDLFFKFISENAKSVIFQRGDFGLFLVPFAFGTVLIALLIDRNIAVIYSVMVSVFVGILLNFDFRIALYAFLSSLSAIYATVNFKQKRLSFRVSLFVAIFNFFLVTLLLVDDEAFSNPRMLLYASSLGFLSSMPVGLMFTATFLPIIENFYNLISDVRLLELSNLNNPLLNRLAIEAPGSYNHSIMIAQLAESVAPSVQANPLFCRVSAYYHDVGKLLNPQYFVENQGREGNPHDRLKPEMSALIVKSHVKEGIRLAKSYGIPDALVDIIPQHHGTRRISYFYDRALTLNDPEKDQINESDFCYQGPKPQSKEAAIIMLADSLEASARVLKDPSSHRIETMIDEIIQKILLEEQLNECDLTLKELAILKEAFFKAIIGVFAKRISYPQFDFDKEEESGKEKKS